MEKIRPETLELLIKAASQLEIAMWALNYDADELRQHNNIGAMDHWRRVDRIQEYLDHLNQMIKVGRDGALGQFR